MIFPSLYKRIAKKNYLLGAVVCASEVKREPCNQISLKMQRVCFSIKHSPHVSHKCILASWEDEQCTCSGLFKLNVGKRSIFRKLGTVWLFFLNEKEQKKETKVPATVLSRLLDVYLLVFVYAEDILQRTIWQDYRLLHRHRSGYK